MCLSEHLERGWFGTRNMLKGVYAVEKIRVGRKVRVLVNEEE